MPVTTKEISPGTPTEKRYVVIIDEDLELITDDNPLPVSNVGVPPTDDSLNNPSMVLTYVGGELTQIVKTINGANYTKTFTWVGGELTAISVWV